MACYIFGAGSFYGLTARPRAGDFTIAADGGWLACRKTEVIPDLLLGDFDSLSAQPDFPNILRVPVEKDDTDTMLAVKTGLERGETEFHIYGGMGGRTDHTIANLQGLLYLADHGARGWLYGDRERFTAIRDGSITLPAREKGNSGRPAPHQPPAGGSFPPGGSQSSAAGMPRPYNPITSKREVLSCHLHGKNTRRLSAIRCCLPSPTSVPSCSASSSARI